MYTPRTLSADIENPNQTHSICRTKNP